MTAPLRPLRFRTLRQHRVRTVLHGFALIVSTLVFITAIVSLVNVDQRARVSDSTSFGHSNLDIVADPGTSLSQTLLASLGKTHGVVQTASLKEKRTIATTTADATSSNVVNIAATNNGTVAFRSVLVVSGKLPVASASSTIAIDTSLTTALEPSLGHPLHIGSTLYLLARTGFQPFTVVGLTNGTTAGPAFLPASIYISQAEANASFTPGMTIPLVGTTLAHGTTAAQVVADLGRKLSASYASIPPRSGSVGPSVGSLQAMFILLAILIAGGGLATTVAVTMLSSLERQREFGLLQLVGARATHVLMLMLDDTLLISLPSVVIGTGGGILLARWLLTHSASLSANQSSITYPWGGIIACALGMILATILSAAVPTLILLSRQPLDLLGSQPRARHMRHRSVWAVWSCICIVIAAISGAYGSSIGWFICWGGIIAATLTGAGVVVPLCTQLIGRIVGAFAWFATIASRNLVTKQTRSTILSTGLGIGVATTLSVMLLVQGTYGGTTSWISHLFAGSTVFSSSAVENPDVADAIARTSGVTTVRPIRLLSAVVDHTLMPLSVITPSQYINTSAPIVIRPSRTAAFHTLQSSPSVFVPQSIATQMHWIVGQELTIDSATGTAHITIAGIIQHSFPAANGQESLMMSLQIAGSLLGPITSGFNVLDITSSLSAATLNHLALTYGLDAVATSTMIQSANNALNVFLGPLIPLSIAVLILIELTFIAILATAMDHNRSTITLLRILGMSSRQVFDYLILEAIVLGVVGTVLGAFLGILESFPLFGLINSVNFQPVIVLNFIIIPAACVTGIFIPAVSVIVPGVAVAQNQVTRMDAM